MPMFISRGLADPALSVIDGVAEAVIEALPVEDDLPAVVTAHQPGPADIVAQR